MTTERRIAWGAMGLLLVLGIWITYFEVGMRLHYARQKSEVRSTIYMSIKDRQELAFILGQIVGILNTVSRDCGMPADKLESLMETVSAFTKKGISE